MQIQPIRTFGGERTNVVYFGDGITPKTRLRGFKVTGAKNFTMGSGEKSPIAKSLYDFTRKVVARVDEIRAAASESVIQIQ